MSDRKLLRHTLELDAIATGAMAVGVLAAAGAIDGFLGMPVEFLRATGAFLALFALDVGYVATRRAIPTGAARAVAAANGAWVVASVALIVFDWFTPSTEGVVLVALQAVAVAGFASLQSYALTAPARSSASAVTPSAG